MEEYRKFRNHISIIAEQIGGGIIALAVFAAAVVIQDFNEVSDMAADLADSGFSAENHIPAVILGLLAILAVIAANRFFVWSKTWICIEDNAVVIEVNTVNKKKNTIGIRNISNINLEQTLFEMLLGTCKVKFDTNSRSTADRTDVKIILKKKDAERFKQDILARMRACGDGDNLYSPGGNAGTGAESPGSADVFTGTRTGRDLFAEAEENFDVRADLADILQHGVFSVSLFSLLVLAGGITGTVVAIDRLLKQPEFMKTLVSAAAVILVVAALVFSALWDTVKDFICYYDFRARRVGERIYIRYGLLKKVEYMIPVDKIQALKIRQSFVARLSRRYMAEIVNVGMGDEQEEKNSFLLLYMKEKKLESCLNLLLPEFAGAVKERTQRQPASVWAAWMIPFGIYGICVAGIGYAVWSSFPEYRGWILPAAAGVLLVTLFFLFLSYITSGVGIGEEFLKLNGGFLGKNQICMRYGNIQYVEIKENPAAKMFGIRHGKIHLLASAGNSEHTIPYYRGNQEEKIRTYMLRRRRGR